jgi:hypothetical protein
MSQISMKRKKTGPAMVRKLYVVVTVESRDTRWRHP